MVWTDNVDREAEDVELGQDNDLAADIDDGDIDAVSDPEALDTEDEEDGLDIIDEASDGESYQPASKCCTIRVDV
jgi:ATP-dependent RNA helicase DHX37/DHR1